MAAAGDQYLLNLMALYSKSAGKYLRYTSEKGELNRTVAAKGHQVTSPHGKFELVGSEVYPKMVHIRCCYNNRFLARRSETEFWIVANADEPVDDLTIWSSTLFTIEQSVSTDGKYIISFRLLHVQTKRYAEWYDDSANQYSMCIWVHSTNPAEPKAEFIVADWQLLTELPRVLCFKGSNGRYVGLAEGNDASLQFLYDDPKNVTVVQQVSDVAPNNDTDIGTDILIKNQSNSGMWITKDSYAYAMAGRDGEEITAIKVINKDDAIVLRHFKTRKFFRLLTQSSTHPPTYYLVADATKIDADAHLVVTDLIPTRTIDGFNFHLADGWVPRLILTEVLNEGEPVINDTDETQTIEMKIPYVDKRTKSTFKATTPSFKKGSVDGIKPVEIPCVIGPPATMKMGPPFVPSFVWGGTTPAPIHQVIIPHKVTLPPRTKATVELSAMVGICNVPFTYTRYDGEDESASIMEDGLYTGTNYFNFVCKDSPPEPINKKL